MQCLIVLVCESVSSMVAQASLLLQLLFDVLLLTITFFTEAIVQGELDNANTFPQVCALLDSSQNVICSGILVSQTSLLTAAHCLERITFASCDAAISSSSARYNITAQDGHPSFADRTIPEEQRDDLAVITLGSPASAGAPAAQLPSEWQLEDLKEAGRFDAENAFTVVGYGSTQAVFDPDGPRENPGPPNTQRHFTSANYVMLDLWKLHLSVALSRGEGGSICNGDSGGPVFHKAANLLIGLMVMSDKQCSNDGVVQRLDLPEVRSWLAEKNVIIPDKR